MWIEKEDISDFTLWNHINNNLLLGHPVISVQKTMAIENKYNVLYINRVSLKKKCLLEILKYFLFSLSLYISLYS